MPNHTASRTLTRIRDRAHVRVTDYPYALLVGETTTAATCAGLAGDVLGQIVLGYVAVNLAWSLHQPQAQDSTGPE